MNNYYSCLSGHPKTVAVDKNVKYKSIKQNEDNKFSAIFKLKTFK